MAKRKRAPGPNMSEQIRRILTENPTASNKDIFQALSSKFGKRSFNEASCGVAASNQRKKLGLAKSKKVTKRRPKKTPAAVRGATSSKPVDLGALRAAKTMLSAVGGDTEAAINAIRQLQTLQIAD